MSRLIHQPDAEVLRRLQRDYRARRHSGVGGKCAPTSRLGRQQQVDPRCYNIEYLACCKVKIARAALNVGANTAFNITMEPQTSPFFKPCATTLEVTNTADVTDRTAVRIANIDIQGCPQLGIRTATPVVGTTEVFLSTEWDPLNRAGCACPVGWGTFSNAANTAPLTLTGFNNNNFAVDVYLAVYGDPKEHAPECGCGYDKDKMPTVTTFGATPPGRQPGTGAGE